MKHRKPIWREGTVNNDGCKPAPLTPKPNIKPKPMPRPVRHMYVIIKEQ